MSLKISCLLVVIAVVGTQCSPFRFGGSAGASSHTEAGVSAGGQIGKNEDGSLGASTRGRLHGDWSGGAAAGGYAGEGNAKYDPTNNITGAGAGGLVTAHLGGSTGGVAGGNYKDGKLTGDVGSVSTIDKSVAASGSGFAGTATQQEAEYIGGYGGRTGNIPAAGAPYGGQYGAPFGAPYGYQPYGAPYGGGYGAPIGGGYSGTYGIPVGAQQNDARLKA